MSFTSIVSSARNTVRNLLGLGGYASTGSDGNTHYTGRIPTNTEDAIAKVINPIYGLKSGYESFKDFFGLDDADPNSALGSSGSGSGSGYYYPGDSSGTPGQIELNYPNAALAQLYGMDVPTAYQEALSNTAIQRRMSDYKAAGLNPVLAAHYNSGADSFSGSALSAVSGSSAGSGYTPTSSGNGSSAKGFSELMKSSDYRSAMAAIASAGTMMVTKNFQLGAAAYYGVRGYLNSRYGRR